MINDFKHFTSEKHVTNVIYVINRCINKEPVRGWGVAHVRNNPLVYNSKFNDPEFDRD